MLLSQRLYQNHNIIVGSLALNQKSKLKTQ